MNKKIIFLVTLVFAAIISCKDNVTNSIQYIVETVSDWTSRANVRANEKIDFGPIYIVDNSNFFDRQKR